MKSIDQLHQQNVFQSLEASRSVSEDAEWTIGSVNFRKVSDPRRAFRPAFRLSGISDDWFWSDWDHRELVQVVLATGPDTCPAVQFLLGISVWFGSRPGQKPDLFSLGRFVTRTEQRTVGFWPGWNRTAVPNIWLPHVWLQLSVWVLILLWHGQYVNCTVLCGLTPPAFRFVIRPILIALRWNHAKFHPKFAGFRSRLSEYWSDHKYERGRCKSA